MSDDNSKMKFLLLCLIQLSTGFNFSSLPLVQRINLVKEDCGEVCDTDIEGHEVTKFGLKYFEIRKDVDCAGLFSSPLVEFSGENTAKRPPLLDDLPKSVLRQFTYGDRIPALFHYLDDSGGKTHLTEEWDDELMDNLIDEFESDRMAGAYGVEAVRNISRHIKEHLNLEGGGGRVLVIGTQVPWLEAMLLSLGAKHITTLEYEGAVTSTDPRLEVLTPEKLRERVNKVGWHNFPKFDAVVTYSSLEHSGLGRYGDALNPWGDLIASAKAWCLTRPAGRFLVGVPVGYDGLLFNSCRLYGPLLTSHLLANWDLVHTEAVFYDDGKDTKQEDFFEDAVYGYQPIFVAEKAAQIKQEL